MTDHFLRYKSYTASPEYSAADHLFYGRILGIDDLVDFSASTVDDLEKKFRNAVDDYLAFCEEIGKEPQKEYSGTFHILLPIISYHKGGVLISVQSCSFLSFFNCNCSITIF